MAFTTFILGTLILIICFLFVIKQTLFRHQGMQKFFRDHFSKNKRAYIFSILLSFLLISIVVLLPYNSTILFEIRSYLNSYLPEGIFNGVLSLFELITLLLAVIGASFAILAKLEAKGAFDKSKEVYEKSKEIIEAIASFRTNFSQIMEEIPIFIEESQHALAIMIPTPYYGFLFNQEKAASRFRDVLITKLLEFRNEESNLKNISIIIINPKVNGDSQSVDYIRLAEDKKVVCDFVDSTKEIMTAIMQAKDHAPSGKTIKVYKLSRYDPHIRLFIADERQFPRSLVVFTETKIKQMITVTDFAASGYYSQRSEMVSSLCMLYDLFITDAEPIEDFNSFVSEMTRIPN